MTPSQLIDVDVGSNLNTVCFVLVLDDFRVDIERNFVALFAEHLLVLDLYVAVQ